MAIKMESTLIAHSRHRTSVLMIPASGKWIRSGFQIPSASSHSDVETDMINFFVFHFCEYLQLLTPLLVKFNSTVLIYVHYLQENVSAHLEYG